MKNLYAFIIIVTAFILITHTGYCEDKEVRIYFGNGVWNDEEDALNGQIALRKHLENVLTTNDLKVSWDISYNPTDGLYDLFEAAQQSVGLAWTAFWRSLSGLDLLPGFLQEELKKIATKFDEDQIKSYPSIQEHIKKYNKDLCEGKKVVVVAHSQGNLFANIAYKGINKDNIDGFGIVSVANPSGYVAGDSSDTYYTTIEEDKVIAVIPFALRANVNNFPDDNPDDLSGHMFVNSYLASDLQAESKILNDVVGKIYSLEWPECSCQFLIVTCSVESGDDFCIVWDIEKRQPAGGIPLNTGSMASFPCKTVDISNWLAEKSMAGEPAINVSDPVKGSPLYGPSLPPTTYAYYYNDTNCKQERRCLTESASGSDTIELIGIDENGNDSFTADRTNYFIRKDGGYGPAYQQFYQTYETPVGAGLQVNITSLTNNGGTRARAVGGLYNKSEERWWCVDSAWPCSEETQWYWIDRTTDVSLTYKSPFSDKEVKNVNLLSKEEAKVSSDRTCITQRKAELISDEKFTAQGVRNSKYMVLYYTNEVKGIENTLPCCSDQGSSYIECSPYGGFRSVSYWNCSDGFAYTNYPVINFEVKAFVKKAGFNENTIDFNPFEVPEDANLGTAMLNLKNHTASFSAQPTENYCTKIAFGLHFIK